MKVPPKLFLIGPMGSGKSVVGKKLAAKLGVPFVDSDREIENRTGATISWIFDVEGEVGFRQREEAMIDELTQRSPIVLATGGGVVLAEQNRHCLKSRGVVVLLSATVDTLLERTAKDTQRPLLQTENRREVIEQLLAARMPLYEAAADIVIPTDGGGLGRTVNRIIQAVKPFYNPSEST